MEQQRALRVLLVEDDTDSARLVTRRLRLCRKARFAVTRAADLQSALAALERDPFDVLLLDLGLPDGRGMSTITAAGAVASHVPVVVLTASEDEELALTAVQAGAQDYLVKRRQDRKSLTASILHAIVRHRRYVAVREIASI